MNDSNSGVGKNKWMSIMNVSLLIECMEKVRRDSGGRICPPESNVLRAFRLCPYENMRVVMIGQDPYPQPGVATGILFGNNIQDGKDASPSLKIIEESVVDYTIPHYGVRFDYTLESWAKQGILMINSSLTTEEGKIGSHMYIWRNFMEDLVRRISINSPEMIFVLFGSQARSLKNSIIGNCTIFECKHPAYYARVGKPARYTVFKDINRILRENNGKEIKWFEEYGKGEDEV